MAVKIINVSATLEDLIAECVGDAPEAVRLKDWRGIALRLMRRLDESGLAIRSRAALALPAETEVGGPMMVSEIYRRISDLYAKPVSSGQEIMELAQGIYALAAAPAAPAIGQAAARAYRHKKRGTLYCVVGEATLQVATDIMGDCEVVLYRGEDGKLWARQEGEFYDRRFEEVDDALARVEQGEGGNDAGA